LPRLWIAPPGRADSSWEQARAVAGYAERMEVSEDQVVVNEGEADASLFLSRRSRASARRSSGASAGS